MNSGGDTYELPFAVMSTAATPKTENASLEYWLPNVDNSSLYYVYLHFAEVEKFQSNQSRKFTVSYNGQEFEPNPPDYLHSTTVYSSSGLLGGAPMIISKIANSTKPPILNAIEIYVMREFFQSDTQETDGMQVVSNTCSSTYC